MFKEVISQTPFVLEYANKFFQDNIMGDSYNGDFSFLSSLRALVYPRMDKSEIVDLYFKTTCLYQAPVNIECPTTYIANRATGFDLKTKHGLVMIQTISSSAAITSQWIDFLRDSFEKEYSGWHLLEKVTLFFSKQLQVLCFVNPELKSVYIITDSMDMRKMHYLQCGIFAFFPWYFDPGQGVNEDEMALISSLREKSSEKYIESIEKIAKNYDFKTLKIKELLSDFETQYERAEIARLNNVIKGLIDSINKRNREIANILEDKYNNEVRLIGLKTKISNSSEESEIMEYFLCNDKLILENVQDGRLDFGVCDYLTYFDEDMAKEFIKNKNSYFYRHNDYLTDSDMEMLMTAIFIDQTIRVKMCAKYSLYADGRSSTWQGEVYSTEYRNFIPNPHIFYYGCLGGYAQKINEQLQKHDYIGAIEQCVASCKSLNVGEAPTMESFIKSLYDLSSIKRFIELPNGNVVSVTEAIEYLKQ